MTGPVATRLRPQIRAHLEAYPDLTTFELARKLKSSKATMTTVLAAMKEEGELTRTTVKGGNGRDAYTWRLAS